MNGTDFCADATCDVETVWKHCAHNQPRPERGKEEL